MKSQYEGSGRKSDVERSKLRNHELCITRLGSLRSEGRRDGCSRLFNLRTRRNERRDVVVEVEVEAWADDVVFDQIAGRMFSGCIW